VKAFYGEKELQQEILSYLRSSGIFPWRQNTGAFLYKKRFVRFGLRGISDIIGIMPDGRFLAIEVKKEKGELTVYQEVFLETMKENGGIAIVTRSLFDVISLMKACPAKQRLARDHLKRDGIKCSGF
jgi:hypothetical protein